MLQFFMINLGETWCVNILIPAKYTWELCNSKPYHGIIKVVVKYRNYIVLQFIK